MPPKRFNPSQPSNSRKTTNPKSSTARKATDSISKTRSITKVKGKGTAKSRGSSGFKPPARLSGLPSLSPDTEADSFGSDAASNSNRSTPEPDPIEIDSQDEPAEVEERREGIPLDLLTRLLHENFKEEGTRLSKDASKAVGKYMETFVREALARAAFARVEVEEAVVGAGDGFLEVEDLEKLAPQLLMDF